MASPRDWPSNLVGRGPLGRSCVGIAMLSLWGRPWEGAEKHYSWAHKTWNQAMSYIVAGLCHYTHMHKCPFLCWASCTNIPDACVQSAGDRAQSTSTAWGGDGHPGHTTGGPCPQRKSRSLKQNSVHPEMEEERSKTSTHQDVKVKYDSAAYRSATWKTLCGRQVPNVEQCLKQTQKQAGWSRGGTAFKWQGGGLLNGRMISCLARWKRSEKSWNRMS